MLIGILVLAAVLVNTTAVQNYLAQKATSMLSKKLRTKVSVRHVRVDFLNKLLLQGLYIEDRGGDTLLYAGEVQVKITDWFFLKKEKPVITYLALHDAYARLQRPANSKDWNYRFVIDAFNTGKKDTSTQQNEFELDLKHLDLQRVRFSMLDGWGGEDMVLAVGKAAIDGNAIDLKKRLIDLSSIGISNTTFAMRSYKAGKPKGPKRAVVDEVDTTAFNEGGWAVKVGSLRLDSCRYIRDANESRPAPTLFDAEHMDIAGATIHARDLRITGDTLTAKLDLLAARERCGLVLKELSGDVTVSPNASIVNHMTLKTAHSTITDYYAMRYTRFPAFTEYIDSVRMTAVLKESIVDPADIARFAPVFTQYFPTEIRASGRFEGTVADFKMVDMNIHEGSDIVTGNLAMKGLPDIDRTFITYTNGAVNSTGASIARFAPALTANPSFDIRALGPVRYAGSYIGYIDNFAANGVLNTGLGMIVANTELNIPGFDTRKAVYSGTIATQGFQLGTLLHNPLIGRLTAKADISGSGFDADAAGMKLNAFIPELDFYGYRYHRITADGILSQKKFDGKLLVDDSALALSFDGSADFSQPEPVIIAKAYLLNSNLQKMGLSKEPLEASADFDLNTTGKSLDDFNGFAKLYNINLRRRGHRLDLDSVYAQSGGMGTADKFLTIESNAASVRISGKYQLSKLGYSAQYLLAQYLPSYINNPKTYATDQDIQFDVSTREVDSLLVVLTPSIRGFDNSTIKGSLNTTSQELKLAINVPYGAINNTRLSNITLNGTGNFQKLTLNGDAGSVLVGDTLLNLSVNLATTVGNDSVGFAVTTASPDSYGTATINGSVVARRDSLYAVLLPSEFFLNGARWQIDGGSKVVYAPNYLFVDGLNLHAGPQHITVQSSSQQGSQGFLTTLKDIDLAQLGGLAKLSDYQPDGRINGTVKIDHLFSGLIATADIDGSDIKLGADTLGTLKIAGAWNGPTQKLTLEPSSGIFRGDASVTASGNVTFDSTSRQRLDGIIRLNGAPLSWVSPFVASLMSGLKGTANGTVKITGTGASPDIDGNIAIKDAAVRIDYIGTTYRIPAATFGITNTSIDFSQVKLYDVFNHVATLGGTVTHNRFSDFRLGLDLKSDDFEVLNLQDYENKTFYGHLVANTQTTIRGPIDDLQMRITATPSGPSHLYLPISNSGSVGSYNYVSFKKYGADEVLTTSKGSKLSLYINAYMNSLAEITMIIDPSTGDQINAKGSGTINMDIPAGGDLKLYGTYNVEEGDYTFTFRQLFFKRQFIINNGSSINFAGSVAQTRLNVNATYGTRASLYDLLTERELPFIPQNELTDTKRLQQVNVILSMTESLQKPKLTFKLELPEKRSVGTYAYTKLERINASDRELFDQVASLLLIGYFIPPEGLSSSTAATGAVNNLSEILSTTTSGQLTNIVNKLLGDPKLQVDFKYKNYNLSDGVSTNPLNRNEVKLGLRQNFLNDRLIIEVGGVYDWGRATSANSSTSNFNLLNDFRVQYLLSKDGRLRVNGFRTSDYDALVGDNGTNVTRAGVGLSWRKTFDSWNEFWHTPNYYQRRKELEESLKVDSTVGKKSIGTE